NNNNVSIQDFCITSNGSHPDLEIVIAPIMPAKPGFRARYAIVFKNIGNQVKSQDNGISFFYDANLMEFDDSISFPVPSEQSPGVLHWDYSNLMPFESRYFVVDFQINS